MPQIKIDWARYESLINEKAAKEDFINQRYRELVIEKTIEKTMQIASNSLQIRRRPFVLDPEKNYPGEELWPMTPEGEQRRDLKLELFHKLLEDFPEVDIDNEGLRRKYHMLFTG